jgi:hypothetical protein
MVPAKSSASLQPQIAPGHFVEFYESEDVLDEHLADYVRRGLALSEPVLVIAEPERRTHLEQFGAEIGQAVQSGKLVVLDAREMLATFMVGESPSAELFCRVVGGKVDELSRRHKRLWAYGEMVNVLWREGNSRGALELEALWNALGSRAEFSLMCSYAKANFIRESPTGEGIAEVCRIHDHVVPAQRATPVPTRK